MLYLYAVSDEHGVPDHYHCASRGSDPQQVVDKYHKMMGDSFREFGISFSI
jgi:methionyl-tRNA synthetase